MGYYDSHNPQDPQGPQQRPTVIKKGSKGGYFFSGFIGVIIGALLVWLMMPSLVGLMPSSEPTNDVQSSQSSKTTSNTEQLSASITTDVTSAVEKAAGAVVGVTNIQKTQSFFQQSAEEQPTGVGSGVIYKKANGKAYVVTNNHVVEGASRVEVTLQDGSKIEAKILGTDVWTDLAVLEMDGSKVKTVAQFGDSDVLKQGETVIAIGNPLGLDFSGSVTTGVVSGKDRTIPVDLNKDGQQDWQAEVLQTDAAINPGNSGGALINLTGQLIGINSMKIAETQVEGIGLAIPINSAIPVIEDLQKYGEVKRPTMGVTLVDVTNVSAYDQQSTLRLPEEVTTGVVVDDVVPNSPASRAGLKRFDVIVEMDGKKINNMIELRKHLYTEKEIGDKLKVKVYRGGELMEVELKLTDSNSL